MSGKGFFFREPKTACQVDFSRILTPVCQNKSKGKKKKEHLCPIWKDLFVVQISLMIQPHP